MEWLTGLLAGIIIAIVGYFITQQKRKVEKRDDLIEALAALRFELQSNLEWVDNIFESRIYLRDEAWVTLKNKGYITYLPAPIPIKVIFTYEKLHSLNEQVHNMREKPDKFNPEKAKQGKAETRSEFINLIRLLDIHYPKIGKNFKA